MRPKIVIITVLGAFVVLAAVALFKGLGGKEAPKTDGQTPAGQPTSNISLTPSNNPALAGGGAPANVTPEMRAVVISKEVEDIQTLVGGADGTNNVDIISTLVTKLPGSEPEVRQAVLDGLRQMNDTNAVAPLQRALDSIQDARQKVAVLDLIDYLRTPSITQNVPADLTTNPAFVPPARKARH